jgi:N-methylhydantoinase A/acetone carboxylase, beta subunit
MKIGIGIDTGGTYTDAVIYDFSQKSILSSTKALTTKEDLSIGIGYALDGLPYDLLKKAEIISLSTTLATNACVENKGGRAKLLFIGVDKGVVGKIGCNYGLPSADEIYFLDSEGTFDGEILREPDWEAFLKEGSQWLSDADSVGIVEVYAIKNNAVLERKAKDLVSEKLNLPAVCGHELFSDLNSIQRGSSTLLNARLIPVIDGFLKAIKCALQKRGITAPVVIVRSDGSLMSEKFTNARPVETLLCGPAASVMGGMELAGEKNCLVVDMGGTTTDIAIIRDGIPVKSRDGINVGKWRTYVKGLFIDTFGLGGDSAVRFDDSRNMSVEPVRLIPLSIAAAKWPITPKLHELLEKKKRHTLLLHEFFCLVRDISNNNNYTQEEIEFCKALKDGPLIFSDAAAAIGKDIYNFRMERLEKEGVIIRCGLTPTDIMHIKGDFKKYDREAAGLGARFVASSLDIDVSTLCDTVYDSVKRSLYYNIVRMLLEERYPTLAKNGLGMNLEALILDSWEMAKTGERLKALNFSFDTSLTFVGIGAPVHIFLPDVAKALGTKCVIPENAGVANALGAVVGNISATCEVEVKPVYTSYGINKYVVYGKNQNIYVKDKDEAIKVAISEAKASAENEAIKRGATGNISVAYDVISDSAESRDKIEIFLGTKVVATAVGRLSL